MTTLGIRYCIVVSTSPSCFEAHAGLFRLLMKRIFDAYGLWPFDKSFVFDVKMFVIIRDFTVTDN